MQSLLEADNHAVAATGTRFNVMKTKVTSALIPGGQCQAVVLNGEPLEDADKCMYLSSMFIVNGLSTKVIQSRINLARSAFSRMH